VLPRNTLARMADVVSESIRAALVDADALIARVNAALAGDPSCVNVTVDSHSDQTATAHRIADEWQGQFEAVVHESQLADAARQFRQRWPALVRWRERVLTNRRHAKPSLVAAAYESLALECLMAGEYELSARAQQEALRVMQPRVHRGSDTATEAKSA
jgi:hypothetical protein